MIKEIKEKALTYILFVLMVTALSSFLYLAYINKDAQAQVEEAEKLTQSMVSDYERSDEDKEMTDFVDQNLKRNIDFKALKAKNKDTYMWLYYPDSKFDFPVVMEREVGKYHYDLINFEGKKTFSGTPLIPKSPEGEDFRTLILSHRMINYWGEDDYLFSHLPKRWADKESSEEAKYVYTYKDNMSYRWKIWTSLPLRGDDIVYQTPYEKDSEDYAKLLEHIKGTTQYTIGEDPDASVPTLMLSTCSKASDTVNIGRFCVIFKLDQIYDKKKGTLEYFNDDNLAEKWLAENDEMRDGDGK